MAELDPDGGLLLREFQNVAAMAIVTAIGFDEITGWDWSASPDFPADVDVETSGETLTVSWELVEDFPIQAIRYRDEGGGVVTVDRWSEVPQGAPIIEFEAHPINKRQITLSATVHGIVEIEPVSVSGTYTVEILHQYDVNRDILKEKADAGSQPRG